MTEKIPSGPVQPPSLREKPHAGELYRRLGQQLKAFHGRAQPVLRQVGQGFYSVFRGLSGYLLLLTALFVAVMVIIILVPSMAAHQERWLIDRVRQAEIASLALDASPESTVSRELSSQLLGSVGATYLALQNNGVRDFVLRDPEASVEPDTVRIIRGENNLSDDIAYLWGPWKTLMGPPDRLIRTEAPPRLRKGADIIELVVPAEPLKTELKGQMGSILRLSILISLAAGALVFVSLLFFIVLPVRNLTRAIARFKENPEDITITTGRFRRRDEIGQIEQELAQMQEEVRHSLRSRARLAALGQAVSKINHDLRNMLTAAQMASERLAYSGDPNVTKALPRLERALDRALTLAENVLNYGKSDELPAQIQSVALRELAEAAAEDAGLGGAAEAGDKVRFAFKAADGFLFDADPDHIHRLLVNLMRNARQAMEAQGARTDAGQVTLSAVKTADEVIIVVSDNGPGIPERIRASLFQPFSASGSRGGTGLGLAISRDLARTHGGDVRLIETGPEGTSFEVRIPQKR